jgi:hypothetical protein
MILSPNWRISSYDAGEACGVVLATAETASIFSALSP